MEGLFFTGLFFILSFIHPATNAFLFYLNSVVKKTYNRSVSKYKLINIVNLFIGAVSPFIGALLFVFIPDTDIHTMVGILVGIGMLIRILLIPADIFFLVYKGSKAEVYESKENTIKIIKKYLIVQTIILAVLAFLPLLTYSAF